MKLKKLFIRQKQSIRQMELSEMTTGVIIGLIVIAFITVALYKKKSSTEQTYYPSTVPSTVDKTIPDSVVTFGHKCM